MSFVCSLGVGCGRWGFLSLRDPTTRWSGHPGGGWLLAMVGRLAPKRCKHGTRVLGFGWEGLGGAAARFWWLGAEGGASCRCATRPQGGRATL
jgi:hypothetical protein